MLGRIGPALGRLRLAVEADLDGVISLGLGGNFLSASPDTEFTAAALRSCELTAHISTKLNRSHLITGRTALILPCLGRSEIDLQAEGPQFVTLEDSMSIVNRSEGHAKPASGHLRSEPAIIAGMAKATLGNRSAVNWDRLVGNYARIRDSIARVIPVFENFNERIREGYFRLPNPTRDQREFSNRGEKGQIHDPSQCEVQRLTTGQYWMMTIRSNDQFNTTIYGLDDRYRGVYNGRRVIFMNPDDMRTKGCSKANSSISLVISAVRNAPPPISRSPLTRFPVDVRQRIIQRPIHWFISRASAKSAIRPLRNR